MYATRYELEEPEPSPLFDISYNDEFPLARRKISRRRAETIHDIPEERTLSNFSFDSISSSVDDENLHLNHGFASESNIPSVRVFNESLVEKLKPIYDDIVDKKNMMIHYNILADAEHYSNFVRVARDLQNLDPSNGSVDDRLALFLNVYNMMVLHMTNKYGPPQDLWQRRKLVNTTYYQVHEHRYSLHSILNGILRSNRRGHGMLWKPLGKEDLRLPLIMPKCDPLVHFGIISCSKSSPSLRLYDGPNVHQQLVENAVAYLLDNKNMLVDRKRQTLFIPKVFKWYAVDFGNCQEATVDWILNLLEEDETEKSYALRKMCYNEGYTVEYMPYDWEFNGIDQHNDISSSVDDENLHLNHGFASESNIPSVRVFNESLVEKLKPIYDDIVDKKNMMIHYNILADAEHYSNFVRVARDLQNLDPSNGSVDDRLALFLNVYNMMVLHMTNKYGPPQDLWQRRKLVNTTYYQVHEHRYSLHSILNGILRSNRRGHGMLWKPLGKEDLRLPLIMPKCDPLVHFGIISCSKSTPSLRLYDGPNVHQQLVENAVAYLLDNKNMLVDRKRQTLFIPKVFKWYAVDFGNCQEATVDWILNLLEEDETEKSYALRKMCYNEGHTVEYMPYDWEFNGIDQHNE